MKGEKGCNSKKIELELRLIFVFFAIAIAMLMIFCLRANAEGNGEARVFIYNNYNAQNLTIFIDGEENRTYSIREGGPYNIDNYTLEEGEHVFKAQLQNGAYDYNITKVTANNSIDVYLEPTIKNWTFMVYIDADNNLEKFGIKDFNEMEQIGSTKEVNIVVLFDRWNGTNGEISEDDTSNGNWTNTKLYYVTKDNDTENITSVELENMTEQNMGDPNTLFNFVNNSINNFPAENYILVLWNHGAGCFGVCLDEQDNEDYLSMDELKEALENIYINNTKIDILGFDACLMQMSEVCYQIKDYTDYCIASENIEPGGGWDYEEILKNLTQNSGVTPKDLADIVVDSYFNYYGKNNNYTLSAVDMSSMNDVAIKLDDFAKKLKDNFSKYENEIRYCRNRTQSYENWSVVSIDIYHFAYLINETIDNKEIQNSSKQMMNAIENAVITEQHGNESKNSTGLAIYFPLNQSEYYEIYKNLNMSNVTLWDEFLKEFFNIEDWFFDVEYYTYDSGWDDLEDSVELEFNVDTDQDEDDVSVWAYLKNSTTDETVDDDWIDYTVWDEEKDYEYLYLTVPKDGKEGYYYVYLELYDSNWELDDTFTTENFYLYPLDKAKEGFAEVWVYNDFGPQNVTIYIDDEWIGEYWVETGDNYIDNYTLKEGRHYFEAELENTAYSESLEDINDNETTRVDLYPEFPGKTDIYVYYDETPPELDDGKIKDEEWNDIESYWIRMKDGSDVEFKVLHDDSNLYFFVRYDDSNNDSFDDMFGILFDANLNDEIGIGDDAMYILGGNHSGDLCFYDDEPENDTDYEGVDDVYPLGFQSHWENEQWTFEFAKPLNSKDTNGCDISLDIFDNITIMFYRKSKVPEMDNSSYDMIKLIIMPELNSKIYGYVNDSKTNLPIEGASIGLWDDEHELFFGNSTNESGYYEIKIYLGEFYVWFDAPNYNGHDEVINIGEEEFELNVLLEKKPEESSKLYGFVNNSATGEPIEFVWIDFWNEEHGYGNSTWTNESGYYEINLYEGNWEIEIEEDGYIPYNEYIYIGEYEEIWHNISLTPPNATIKGFLNDENGMPINSTDKGMIFGYNFIYDAGNGTISDDTGYFELNVWSGLNMVGAQVDGYYQNFTVIFIKDNETLWHNITLHTLLNNNAIIKGNVTNKNGEGLEGAVVYLANNIIGFPFDEHKDWEFSSVTNATGYYEIVVPEGNYFLVVEYEDSNDNNNEIGTIKEVQIKGVTIKNVELISSEIKSNSTITFDDWNNAKIEMFMPFLMDGAIGVTRLQIDFMIGNKDGTVNEKEGKIFEEFFKFMLQYEEKEDKKNSTDDDFYVDNIYYLFENESFFENFELVNITGNIIDSSPVWIHIKGNLTSNEIIVKNFTHTIEINVTYESGDDEFGIRKIILPKGFTMYEYFATENVSVKGLFSSKIILEFIGKYEDNYEWVKINVSANTPPTADAGNDIIVNEGDEVQFHGVINDPDVDDTHTIEWIFGDGSKASILNPKHIYSDDGIYNVSLKVTDKYGASDYDEIKVTVKNVAPDVEAGNDKIVDKGEIVKFNGTFTDPGLNDTYTIQWDFGDGNTTEGSLTPTHIYAKGGIYNVTLTIVDDDDGIGKDSLIVKVRQITEKKILKIENSTVMIIAYIIGEDIKVNLTTNPDPNEVGNIGIFVDVNLTSSELIWLNITISYKDKDLPENVKAENLKIYYWKDNNWVLCENSSVDTTKKLVWANVTHLTIFAPRDDKAEPPPTETHPDLEILELTFSNTKPKEGDVVKINVIIKNIGNDTAKGVTVELYVGFTLYDTQIIGDVEVGKTLNVTFTWNATKGKHELTVWVKANNEGIAYEGNNKVVKIVNVEKKEEEKEFPVIVVIAIIVIILVLIGLFVLIRKGKSFEKSEDKFASQKGIEEKVETETKTEELEKSSEEKKDLREAEGEEVKEIEEANDKWFNVK